MAIQEWSEKIKMVDLGDEPQFSEEMDGLAEDLEQKPADVALNFASVGFINSSNVAQLLRLRKKMLSIHRRLILCEVSPQVWGVFTVTGLDKIFDFAKNVGTALAALQLKDEGKNG